MVNNEKIHLFANALKQINNKLITRQLYPMLLYEIKHTNTTTKDLRCTVENLNSRPTTAMLPHLFIDSLLFWSKTIKGDDYYSELYEKLLFDEWKKRKKKHIG